MYIFSSAIGYKRTKICQITEGSYFLLLFFSCISWNMSMFKGHAPIIAVGSDDSNSTGPKVLVYEFSESGRRWIRVESIMTINDAVSGELF